MSKIRFGILSTAKIGVDKVIPAMQRGKLTEVVAIASRDGAKAQVAAARLDIGKSHGSYEALLADPDIDAIYNPLPNDMHVAWSIAALQAGKHVLVEKPIGLTAAEGRELLAAAKKFPQLKIMEAFMYRHHPQWQLARRVVSEGGIGQLRTIQTFFSYFNDDPNNIRNIAAVGGGALPDIGCYPISLSRFIFAAEPTRVLGVMEYDPRFQTDRLTSAVLDFGRGTSTFTCGTQLAPYQRVNIFGTQGRFEIEIPFNAPPDRPCKVWHARGQLIEEITLEVADQYTLQGDLFAAAIQNNTAVPTPLEDAVANMEVIEAIVRSAKNGGWEKVVR